MRDYYSRFNGITQAEIDRLMADLADDESPSAGSSRSDAPVFDAEVEAIDRVLSAEIEASTPPKLKADCGTPLTAADMTALMRLEMVCEAPKLAPGEPDPTLAPGCFGGAMLYRKDAKECLSCPFNAQCAPIATDRLARMLLKLGVIEAGEQPPHDELQEKIAYWQKTDKRRGDAKRHREFRAKRRKPAPAKPPLPIAAIALTPEAVKAQIENMSEWLASGDHAARKLRGKRAEILRDQVEFTRLREKVGRDPSPGEFADTLSKKSGHPINRHQARERIRRLCAVTKHMSDYDRKPK